MKNHKKSKLAAGLDRRVGMAVVALMGLGPILTPAMAQYTTQLAERDSKPILEYFLTIAFVVICVAIAAMNPKRSHQA